MEVFNALEQKPTGDSYIMLQNRPTSAFMPSQFNREGKSSLILGQNTSIRNNPFNMFQPQENLASSKISLRQQDSIFNPPVDDIFANMQEEMSEEIEGSPSRKGAVAKPVPKRTGGMVTFGKNEIDNL